MHVAFSAIQFRFYWRGQAQAELDRLIARLLAILDELGQGDGGCRVPTAEPTRPRTEPLTAEASRLTVEIHTRFQAIPTGTSRDGIHVLDPQTLETDRYRIHFESPTTLRITDLKSGEYTRVWGDPHVDVSTVKGVMDGEFSDLSASEDVTTFTLKDGTSVRFQAPVTGLIERVDVTRGATRFSGSGHFDEIGSSCDLSSDAGDVVTAGDDGASWYDERGRLLWGRDAARSRPPGTPAAPASADRSPG